MLSRIEVLPKLKEIVHQKEYESFDEKLKLEIANFTVDIDENMIIHKHNNISNYIPKDVENFLSESLFNQLLDIILVAQKINNDYDNKNIKQAIVELNLTENYIILQEKMINFSKEYSYQRAIKHNNKDKDFVQKMIRLSEELLPSILEIMLIQNSIFSYLLKDFTILIALQLTNEVTSDYIQKITNRIPTYDLGIFKLADSNSLINFIKNIPYVDITKNTEILEECELMAEELLRIKHYIDLKPVEIDILGFGEKVECFWESKNNNILTIPKYKISINYEGIIVDGKYSFLKLSMLNTIINKEEDNNMCNHINLLIITNIYNFFNKIEFDKNNIENRLILNQNSGKIKDINENLNINIKQENSYIKQNSRWNIFIKFLKNEYNCQILDGKGDEIKIHRQGYPMEIIADYKTKKREILAPTIRRILRKLDINSIDWILYDKN